jgi:curved DNA-binding protein CbpA
VAGKNYYKILGLSESASKKEVKRRYKKLVKKCHPDINPDPKAHEEFIIITEAYDFLIALKKSKKKSSESTTSKKSIFEEYRERSRKIFEKRQKRKKEEIEQFYISLKTGWRRNLIWATAL